MLADDLCEPSATRDALHAASRVGRAVEGPGRMDEGLELRAARCRATERDASWGSFASALSRMGTI